MEWATGDLEHAKTLYQECAASGVEVNETWESNEFTWRMRTWQDEVSTPTMGGVRSSVKGLWNVSLAASGPSAHYTFSWTGDGWFAA